MGINRRKVLIVDDEPEIRRILQRYLSSRGYEVQTVQDAEGALVAIRNTRPGLVLLDICLPGMDGLDLMSQITAGPGEKPYVVLMTGLPENEVQRRQEANRARTCLADRDVGIFYKPFPLEELSRMLDEVDSLYRLPAGQAAPNLQKAAFFAVAVLFMAGASYAPGGVPDKIQVALVDFGAVASPSAASESGRDALRQLWSYDDRMELAPQQSSQFALTPGCGSQIVDTARRSGIDYVVVTNVVEGETQKAVAAYVYSASGDGSHLGFYAVGGATETTTALWLRIKKQVEVAMDLNGAAKQERTSKKPDAQQARPRTRNFRLAPKAGMMMGGKSAFGGELSAEWQNTSGMGVSVGIGRFQRSDDTTQQRFWLPTQIQYHFKRSSWLSPKMGIGVCVGQTVENRDGQKYKSINPGPMGSVGVDMFTRSLVQFGVEARYYYSPGLPSGEKSVLGPAVSLVAGVSMGF